jgi:hypothetical protein
LAPGTTNTESNTATVLVITTHVTILMNIPRLTGPRTMSGVVDTTFDSGGSLFLVFFPFLLTGTLAFHLTLQEGL